jgi:hypothetical protein
LRLRHRKRLDLGGQLEQPFSARQSSAATHRISSDVRRFDAVATEIPTPLNSATYAARQAGHLGSKTGVALETTHPAISPLRRICAGHREEFAIHGAKVAEKSV